MQMRLFLRIHRFARFFFPLPFQPLIVNVSQCVYSQVYIGTAEKKKRGGKKSGIG